MLLAEMKVTDKRKPVVIFGSGMISRVATEIFEDRQNIKVLGYAVHKKYIRDHEWLDKPVFEFESLKTRFDPQEINVFVAVGYQNMNGIRESICNQFTDMNFKLVNCVDPSVYVPKSINIGHNNLIMAGVTFQSNTKIGNNNFFWSSSTIGHDSIIQNNNWFTSATKVAGKTTIKNNNFFGIGSTVTDNVNIGDNCLIGAGCFVSKSLEDNQVIIKPSDKVYRLNTERFLKLSSFNNI